MKKTLTLTTVFLIVIIAVLTNPSKETHVEVLRTKFNILMQQSLVEKSNKSDSENEDIGKALGLMIGGAFVDGMLNNIVSVDNYVLFSITKITWDGETKKIGIGAFGNVFLSERLESASEEIAITK